MANIKSLTNGMEGILAYLTEKLNWPIDQDNPAEDATWEYFPEDIGLSGDDFAKIEQLSQLKPLTDDQQWACFFVIFDTKKMQVTVLRKILGALIYQKRNAPDHKIWDKKNLLFICQWGTKSERTIGFVHFDDSTKSLPTLKEFHFCTKNQDEQFLQNMESKVLNLKWEFKGHCPEWTDNWKQAFTSERGQVIRDTKMLTVALAAAAKNVQAKITELFEIENEKGYVNELYKKFKTTLVHDMTQAQFADMYAQTITYGLFSARCLGTENKTNNNFNPIEAINAIPDTNPFLRELLREGFQERKGMLSFDELELSSIVERLQETDIESIVADFNRQSQSGREDPVIHFYEDFLTEYDRETRMDRGVFYTPVPVVDFIVRSVDQILKTEFNIADGLAADDTVQILDPATGTGTFLRQTILLIEKEFKEKHKNLSKAVLAEKWNEYVGKSLLPRVYGFELMMAPYAVAHMKLAMALKQTGYNFADKNRLNVFLTNSLEDVANENYSQGDWFESDPITQEGEAANKVKKDAKINVVIGNPPYSGISSNNSKWITDLINDYRFVAGKPLGEKKVWFNDDYCKFIRLGQNFIEQNGSGILAFINNNGFIDNKSFKGMRWSLLNSFDEIYILDLHGNAMRHEKTADGGKDENIFNIMVGVSINIFIKNNSKKAGDLAKVYHAESLGMKNEKFNFLRSIKINDINWKLITPEAPDYILRFEDSLLKKSYNDSFSVVEILGNNTTGIVTMGDNFALDKSKEKLENKIKDFIKNSYTENELNEKYDLGKNYAKFINSNKKSIVFNKEKIRKINYRPFDMRFMYYDENILWRTRKEISDQMKNNNIGLIVSRQAITDNWSHILVSDCMVDNRFIYSNKGIASFFPLYLYNENPELTPGAGSISSQKNSQLSTVNSQLPCTPNLNDAIVKKISDILGIPFSDDDDATIHYSPLTINSPKAISPLAIFDYIYAVLHTPSYREKYKEFLKIDFPRIPYPKDKEQFFALAQKGSQLRELHLMTSPLLEQTPVTFCGKGDSIVSKVEYKENCVYINKTQYFENVGESVWNFYIGGYQPLQKYLKDRKGRTLTKGEAAHYCRVVKALMETERIMASLIDN